ncbi:MAG TPA: hemolysin family protein [Alphaproteobacteria bacterium]|nr:hemolysin family protein [Alphaproteobacteria bacterium]
MNANSRPMEDSLKKTDAESDEPPIGSGQAETVPAPQQNTKDGDGRILGWVKNLLPARQQNSDDMLREAIEELIEEEDSAPQSSVAAHERMLISNILQLRDLPVIDVMVPRADIVAINGSATKEDLYSLLQQKPHSRIPVYKDDLDNIVGVMHMKDLVSALVQGRDFEIRDIMRDVLVVSPAMRVMDLLLQMRQSRVHIAFVVDEFGGIDGLITINDLISAIVGEVEDELDFDIAPQMIERPDGSAIVDARMPLTDFEAKYGKLFTEDEEHEENDTLGGLVSYIAGRVPARGELIKHSSGLEFEVIDADPRRIMRLRVRNLPQKPSAAE